MSKPVVVTARLDAALSAELDRLAAKRDRSRAWLIEKAVAVFVQEQLAFHDALDGAEAAADRGEMLDHDDFMARLRAEFGERRAA